MATLDTPGMTPPADHRRLAHETRSHWRALPASQRLRFGLAGLREFLGGVAGRRPWGLVLASALAPLAVLYVVGTVIRDGMTADPAATPRRRPSERAAYLRHRYGGTQWLVDRRERRIVTALLARTGRPRTIMDAPSGYGRLTPLLQDVATRRVVCADIARQRLAALDRGTARVQADMRGALPFRTGAADVVFTLRYLHHNAAPVQEAALVELARVSRRWVLVSYYRASNLHAVVRALQSVVRANRRRTPTMLDAATFARMVERAGCRRVRERGILPGLHAQRIVLLEKQGAPGAAEAVR